MGSCEAGVLLVVPDGSFWWFDIEGGCDVIANPSRRCRKREISSSPRRGCVQEPTGKDDVNTQVLKNENHKGSNETKSVWPLLDGDTMIDAGGGGGGGSCLFRTRENFFPFESHLRRFCVPCHPPLSRRSTSDVERVVDVVVVGFVQDFPLKHHLTSEMSACARLRLLVDEIELSLRPLEGDRGHEVIEAEDSTSAPVFLLFAPSPWLSGVVTQLKVGRRRWASGAEFRSRG